MAAGDKYSPTLEFLKSVGCSTLPMGACDLLDANNARSIFNTYQAVLRSKFCGTTNLESAKQLLALGDATNPIACRDLLKINGVL